MKTEKWKLSRVVEGVARRRSLKREQSEKRRHSGGTSKSLSLQEELEGFDTFADRRLISDALAVIPRSESALKMFAAARVEDPSLLQLLGVLHSEQDKRIKTTIQCIFNQAEAAARKSSSVQVCCAVALVSMILLRGSSQAILEILSRGIAILRSLQVFVLQVYHAVIMFICI